MEGLTLKKPQNVIFGHFSLREATTARRHFAKSQLSVVQLDCSMFLFYFYFFFYLKLNFQIAVLKHSYATGKQSDKHGSTIA